MLASVSIGTVARVVSDVIVAGGAIVAGRTVAHVYTKLAVGARVARRTRTVVRVDAIDAGATVHAAGLGAVLVVRLTVDAREAERAGACV